MEKKKTSHFAYAIVISLILIVFSIVSYLTGFWLNFISSIVVFFLVFIVGIVVSNIQYSKSVNGNITFGNLFAFGFKVGILAGLICLAWSLLQPIIFSNMQNEMIDYITKIMKQKGADDTLIDKTIEGIKHPNYTLQISGGIFAYALFSVISSLIGAAVAKKNPQAGNPFQQ